MRVLTQARGTRLFVPHARTFQPAKLQASDRMIRRRNIKGPPGQTGSAQHYTRAPGFAGCYPSLSIRTLTRKTAANRMLRGNCGTMRMRQGARSAARASNPPGQKKQAKVWKAGCRPAGQPPWRARALAWAQLVASQVLISVHQLSVPLIWQE